MVPSSVLLAVRIIQLLANALFSNQGGSTTISFGNENTAIGSYALKSNTLGYGNTANGAQALRNNTIGRYNTASGYFALFNNTTGGFNTATGSGALTNNTTGNENTATGYAALSSNTTGADNTATGISALFFNTTGIRNTATGVGALQSNTTGPFNLQDRQRKYSSVRLDCRRSSEPKSQPCRRDDNGEIYTVRYDAVNAMLLNEFLNEHRQVEEQQSTIGELKTAMAQQQKQIEVLTAGLQKVTARIKASQPAPPVASER
jgi:uncharacterized coiled-coil protein SlyX